MRFLEFFMPLLAMAQAQDDMSLEQLFAMGKDSMSMAFIELMKNNLGGCLDVAPPDQLLDIGITCLTTALLNNTEQIRQLDFLPDVNYATAFFTDYRVCLMKELGIDNPYSNHIDDEETMLNASLIQDWTGPDQPTMQRFYTECVTQVNQGGSASTPFRQWLDVENCWTRRTVAYCVAAGKSPGNTIPFAMMAATLHDDPKCMDVRLPDEFQMTGLWLDCMEEKRWNITSNATFINQIVSKPSKMAKAMAFFTRFGADMSVGMLECLTIRNPGCFDLQAMTINVTYISDSVRDFVGYDKQEDREKMHTALMACGAFSNGITPGLESREETAMRLLMTRQAFDQCMLPKMADICGMRNQELTNLFMPAFNRDLVGTFLAEILKSSAFMAFEHLMQFPRN